MLPKVATLSQPAFSPDRRDAKRRAVKLGFDAADGPGKTRVLILDLSKTGMRIQSSANLDIGEQLDIVIPEAGLVSANIVRRTSGGIEDEYGAEFIEPITEAAVSAVLLAAPAFAPPIPEEDANQWLAEARAKFPEPSPMNGLSFAIVLLLVAAISAGFIYAIGFLAVSG